MLAGRHRVEWEQQLHAATDEWGNDTGIEYAAPVDMGVYGWYAASADPGQQTAGDNRVVADVTLLAPFGCPFSDGDRVTLPYAPGGVFKVVGMPLDYNANPFSAWRPGVSVNLKKVTG